MSLDDFSNAEGVRKPSSIQFAFFARRWHGRCLLNSRSVGKSAAGSSQSCTSNGQVREKARYAVCL